ncbi:hypothetical protein ACJDU8_15530 [Clostridium sp. WILCCON 0269]|uniref:Uncharacterized protein n=1 Tax=Candidatus Clostridium eludens TaxID=3381663 RepID=A0ABW8SP41_9CLOT
MNLTTEKEGYINSILDNKCLGWLLPVLETGQSACKAFMNTNNDFFGCEEYLNMVPGHLLSYSINKQLAIQGKLSSCPFLIYKEEINHRNKYSIPILRKSDITISVMRGANRKELNGTDKKYLKKKCRKNNDIPCQETFLNLIDIKDNYHGVLLYGSKKDWEGIEFADIIFFDDELKNINYSINLIGRLHVYQSSMSNEEKQKKLLNANNLIKDFKKQSEG